MRDYRQQVAGLRGAAKGLREIDMPKTADQMDDAADAIEELQNQIVDLNKMVPTWISVEERLPEPFVCVLAHIPGEKPFPTVKSAFLEKNGLWYSNGFRYNPEEVTHWCEMPEPPEGEEKP